MLIKHKNRVINLNRVIEFWTEECPDTNIACISFEYDFYHTAHQDTYSTALLFSTIEERDLAFEKILDAYRWQRMQCTLD